MVDVVMRQDVLGDLTGTKAVVVRKRAVSGCFT